MITDEAVIEQTRNWIKNVVVACNFCPFAAKEIKRNSIHYEVSYASAMEPALKAFTGECVRLDNNENIETSLLIFPESFQDFDQYLDLLALTEKLIRKQQYEGVYQVASFHPLYRFASAPHNDAANYTNRSIYPMLHLLREDSIEKALEKYPDPDNIPERNIRFARDKGEAYMKMLRDSCL
jgi:hypothetical protein